MFKFNVDVDVLWNFENPDIKTFFEESHGNEDSMFFEADRILDPIGAEIKTILEAFQKKNKLKVKKLIVQLETRATEPYWIRETPTSYPNTAKSEKFLLCSVKPASHNSFCALRVKRPEPSLKPHGSTTGLERADQIYATKTPTQLIEPMSNQLNAPTWVTSRHYPTQRTANALACYLNNV
ncbi:hypothetical protein V6N11_078453 [Hibiscus sabdariffa]|uniref:Uncharacterized protein n=1 Tax=Hibiscus sabdariffa TaxID=183260 RepID=A0ABR2TGE7_9ROSI